MKLNKSIVAGHIVISFDNIINGFLSVVMAPLFFGPNLDHSSQLLFSYAAFSIPFIAGPFGAIVFGRFGDKFGRRKALLISILGIGIPILLIGILPTYDVIGIAAPISLISLRFLYMFFLGSEYAGVLIHNHETGNKQPSAASKIISYGIIGGCVAAAVCWVITREDAPDWYWRIPYIIGGVSACFIFVLRKRVQETTDYIKAIEQQYISRSPLSEIMKNYKLEMFTSIMISACYLGAAYSSMIFGNRLFQQAGYSPQQSMLFSLFDLLWLSFSIMVLGKIADKIGVKKMLLTGVSTLVLIAYPTCSLISGELTLFNIYSYMLIVTLLSAFIGSCSATYISSLFPVNCRYSGFGLTDSFGSMFAGVTPFMMLLLSNIFKSNLGCVYWLYTLSIPAFILMLIMNRKLRKIEKLK